jgi:GWxTD domain-containing protein
MTLLEMLVHTPLANAFGWAIFHSLWQGAGAALLLAVTLSMTRSPRVRYAVASLALLAVFIGFVVTLSFSMHTASATPITVTNSLAYGASGAAGYARISVHRRMANALPWLTPFWIAGMLLFHLRSFASWIVTRRLRLQGVCSAADGWQQRLDDLRTRLCVTKPVILLEAALAQSPAVIGYLRPVILVPIGMLTGMPASQIEAVLAHELAHIRRHDYLANLLQMIVEGFLFYHPAVWWISHVIRTERENCCDDLAVEVNGNPRDYATALTVLEENRWAAGQVALAATGGVLMKRIRRLLYPKENPRSFLTPVVSAGILGIVIALALPAWQPAPTDAFSRWLHQDVAYIITVQERAAFEALTTDDERKQFIVQFWERRNPLPGNPENPFQIEHYRRIAYTNDHFSSASGLPGWKTDRGRIYITFGPPDELDSHPNGSATMPAYEEWLYRYLAGIGNDVKIMFVDQNRDGEFHMTMDPNSGPGRGRRVTNPNRQ